MRPVADRKTPARVALILGTAAGVLGICEYSALLGQGAKRIAITKGLSTVEDQQLVLQPNEFWADPVAKSEKLRDQLMRTNREALKVAAPAEVVLESRETAPVIVVRTATIASAAGSPFASTAVLTAVDLDNNYVYASMAITPSGRRTDSQREPPREPPQEGIIGEVFDVDARATLNLPWKPARFLITIVLRDSITARLPVRLAESEVGYKDPEVVKFREQERLRPNVPAVWPRPNTRNAVYDKLLASPPVPEEAGIVMTAPRVVPADDVRPVKLTGAFRLKILPRHIVPHGKAPGAEKLLEQYQGQDQIPTGIVPITLVATGSKSATPFTWRLLVPTFDQVDPAAPGVVTGNFSINLEALGNVRGVEQTLFIYAFSGEVMSGPLPIAFLER